MGAVRHDGGRRARFDRRLRGLLASGLVAVATAAFAQATDTGSGEVLVSPLLTVTVPSVAELRLDASEVTFDLTSSLQSQTMACVYGHEDIDLQGSSVDAFGQPTVFPLGTGFWQSAHRQVVVDGAGAVADYPPLRFDAGGEAVPLSDRDFVCYRSFVLRRFSNLPGWELTVERAAGDEAGDGSTHLYVRASGCTPSPSRQGLHALDPGDRHLLACAESSDPCFEGDVVVLAVKVAAARAGETPAHLVYTLMSPLFDAEP